MYNYMGCSTMMFGSRVRYGITFKMGERSFNIYRRKYEHEYMINVLEDNLEGAKALEIKSMNVFLYTNIDKVNMVDSTTYKKVGELPITLLKSESREPNGVLAIQVC